MRHPLFPDLDLDLGRLDRPGPRYTSYPTVPHWQEDFPVARFLDALSTLEGPASVYVHLPFCEEQCSFCGCTMVPTVQRAAGRRYIDALRQQLAGLPLQDSLSLQVLHLGGGTPTWYGPDELVELTSMLRDAIAFAPGAELSLEADPQVTTHAHLDALADAGFRRISFGVQSFDEKVLEAIRRPQSFDRVRDLVDHARKRGFTGVNVDLVYGLPHQSPEGFDETLELVHTLEPDRLAVYSYAHVPWLKPHQRRLDTAAMPDAEAKLELFARAYRSLRAHGYQFIGMDHFALPDDPLARAQRERRLHRNFMGYTEHKDLPLLGLGMSAISDLRDVYAQQTPRLSRWWQAAERGAVPVEKGITLSREDSIRRDLILELMCNLFVDLDALSARWGVDVPALVHEDLRDLLPHAESGLVAIEGHRVTVTEPGQLFLRSLAMPFDAYLKRPVAGPRHSQAV